MYPYSYLSVILAFRFYHQEETKSGTQTASTGIQESSKNVNFSQECHIFITQNSCES